MATPAAATPMDVVSKLLVSFLDGEKGFCEIMRQRMTKGGSVTSDDDKEFSKRLLEFFARDTQDTLQARKLTKEQALAFRDTFVRPFTTNILKLDQKSAGCMARLVVWWKEHLPDHMDPAEAEKLYLGDLSDVLISEAIYPHKPPEHRTFEQILVGTAGKTFKPKKNTSGSCHSSLLCLLKRATECTDSAGCDALFHLLGFVMKRHEFDVKTLFSAFEIQVNCLDRVLNIFLDPLTVKEAFIIVKGRDITTLNTETLKGEEEAKNSTSNIMKVVWTDDRKTLLALGERQHRKVATEVVENIVLKVLHSRSSTDVLVLRKVTESLKEYNLSSLKCMQVSAKFRHLLEPLIMSVESADTDSEGSVLIENIKLSRQVLNIVFLKLTSSSNTSDTETTQKEIFAEWLLEKALKSPLWWSKVSTEIEQDLHTPDVAVVDPQPSSVDASTVHVALKKYLACMPEAVAKHVLDSVYERLDSLTPNECWLAFEIICGIVEAAENRVQHGLLKSQPQHFWSFVAQNYLQVMALPNVKNTMQILANRTSFNVLAGLFNVLQTSVPVHAVTIAEKISEHARMVLRVSYDEQTFGQMLRVLSSSATKIEPVVNTETAQYSLLEPFIKVLVSNLRHVQADSAEFVARQENLLSLLKALDDPQMSSFLIDTISMHIPVIFDAFDSPFKALVTSLLAKLLHISEDQITRSDLMRDMTGIGGDVDDSRHGGVTFFSAAAPNDHLVRRTDVFKADFQEEAKRLRHLPLRGVVGHKKLPEGSETMLMNTRLILTPKTKANLETICEVIHDPSPLLIEGETGVGKSATIDAAAILTNNKLLRFNMSSRVTIEDFLGKVELTVNDKLGFTKQPFTNAFENGYWLLLDEVNLAPDQVLQRIESVLDSGKLDFSNPSNGADPTFRITQHKDFRLFCTQNPNAGFFRGKREELSSSFLSRFRQVHFEELFATEWRTVVRRKLDSMRHKTTGEPFSNEFLAVLSDQLTDYHTAVRGAISDDTMKFPERAGYAEITIRELLKCTDHIIYLAQHGEFEDENRTVASEWLSLVCQHTYVDRFRGAGATIILEALNCRGFEKKSEATLVLKSVACGEDCIEVRIGRVFLRIELPSIDSLIQLTAKVPRSGSDLVISLCKAHKAVLRLMTTTPFINRYGVYSIDSTWLTDSLDRADPDGALSDASAFCRSVAETYGARVRQQAAQRDVVQIVVDCFVDHHVAQVCVTDIINSLAPGRLGRDLPVAEWAFVITPRVLRLWQRIILASHLPSPILVTGGEACGKSAAIVALARLQNLQILQSCLTPETDPSSLVGQKGPVEGKSKREQAPASIEWQDGIITDGLKKGSWVLLDNFNHGEASVLERLNPVLEVPAQWVLTEKGDTTPLDVADGLQDRVKNAHHCGLREVKLIRKKPITAPHRLDKRALAEVEAPLA